MAGDWRLVTGDFLRYTARLPQPAPERGPLARCECPKEVERIVRTYELMTIFRPEMAEADVRREVDRVSSALTERGAEMKKDDFWGKRRFAYEINHLTEGFYSVLQFEAEPDAIVDIDRALSLSDQVVRHKFFRPE
jgi:small subunit ribosomal protein S6